MIIEEIRAELFKMQDETYRSFQIKLIPTIRPEAMIGVRTPVLRRFAKRMMKREDIGDFLSVLPHEYFDEDQLHAFIICEMKDFSRCMEELCTFLPYMNNWATCDQMSPKIFKEHKHELLPYIKLWIASDETYTVRYAIGMLMGYFLDEDFDLCYPEMVAQVHSEEYYVKMMIAWYFATALAKQYEAVLPFIEGRRLDAWTHNKTIQKSIESYRITPEHKVYLQHLKIFTQNRASD